MNTSDPALTDDLNCSYFVKMGQLTVYHIGSYPLLQNR